MDINREIQTLYQEKRQSQENKVVKEVKNNPTAFYKYANKYRKDTSKIGYLKEGSKHEDDLKKMANILNQLYKSVFTTPKDKPELSLKPP